MKTNKMLPDSSISKVWENFRKMNGIIIEFLVNNWVSQNNGTFTNTVFYEGFTSDEILEIDLYDDGTLTETQISEYDGYITELNVEDGKIVAVATTKPTQTIKILARGEIVGKMVVNGGSSSNISASNVSCLDKDGQTSNVQKELDEQNKNFGNVETVTISSGVTLARCGKTRILSIINPSTASSTIKLPLETDYPTMEVTSTGRISSGTLGMISVKTNGEIIQIQSNGTSANFTTSARYSIMWLTK